MRKLMVLFLFLAVATSPAHGQGTVIDDSFFSAALSAERAVDVYLPFGYDAEDDSTRYPVIYFLHGGSSNQNGYPEILTVADEMIGVSIDPVIIVKPNGNTGPYNGWNWWSNSSTLGQVEDYIAEDLVAYIDAVYNTDARPEKRALMGHSMGATGSMIIGLHNPDSFAAIVSHTGVLQTKLDFSNTIPTVLAENGGSGPFSPSNGVYTTLMFADAAAWSPNPDNGPAYLDLPIDDAGNLIPEVMDRWTDFNPSEMVSSFTVDDLPDIYLDCGEAEPGFIEVNEAFRDSMNAHGLPFQYVPYAGGHMNMLPQRYPVSLAFLDSVFFADVGRLDRAYADPTYYEPGVGEAHILATTVNSLGHTLSLQASVYAESQSSISTIDLFDDGQHGDGEANDGFFGGFWSLPNAEETWYIDIHLEDLTAGTEMTRRRMGAFTTIGPVEFNTLTLYPEGSEPVIGETTFLKIWLENNGTLMDAVDLTMRVSVDEEFADILLGDERPFADLPPGETATHGSYVRIEFLESCEPGVNIPIELDISSGEFELWHDVFYLAPVANSIDDRNEMVPSSYAIESIWPNPFNASTNLTVTLPADGEYHLSIVNIRGQVIQTLLDGPITAGRYLVPFDASALASGVYFATLESELHGVRSQKLVLCK